ncbi:hypothetical protein GLP21_12660 [Photobacterium carnosum]|nr:MULTISPECIES: porin family protein [Photobacterium]MCD9477242.1 hypothetical protein [Photobacterium phosphoreum]MCD9485967.1 hypothetical protein [Photobacterium iliopiscarium]MCD9508771.1 hypothetical protein [Photobacterium phosphoreum]MCD9539304.1 hypothetical protein [Photobacterium carnosum]MCD9543023.1 hypothetical protein [Photobacterium carnosum]
MLAKSRGKNSQLATIISVNWHLIFSTILILVSLTTGLFSSMISADELSESTILSLGTSITTINKTEKLFGATIHLAAISSELKTVGVIVSAGATLKNNKDRGVTQNIFSMGFGPIYQPALLNWLRPYVLVGATTIHNINERSTSSGSMMLLTYSAGVQINIPYVNGLFDIAVSQTPKNKIYNNIYLGVGVHF